jgi:hypothetical protein
MKRTIAGLSLSILAAAPALAAEHVSISSSAPMSYLLAPHLDGMRAASGVDVELEAMGTGEAILDVIDGHAEAAAVAMPLAQALAAARDAARSEGSRLTIPATLRFHAIGSIDGTHVVGFVTRGAPSPAVEKLVVYLKSGAGRAQLAGR